MGGHRYENFRAQMRNLLRRMGARIWKLFGAHMWKLWGGVGGGARM